MEKKSKQVTADPKENKEVAALKARVEMLEEIIAVLPGRVYWKDKNGVYLGCNDKQAESLGLKRGYEIVGKTDFEITWPKECA